MINIPATRLRIAIFEIPPNEENYLRQSALAAHELFFHSEPLKRENINLAENAEALSVFIYSRLGAAELAQRPQLKLIATRSTGFDYLDLKTCRECNITVTNAPLNLSMSFMSTCAAI